MGESGFHLFKLYWSLAVVLLIGLLLAAIAESCFASRRARDRQLVFAATYAITITNEALLRYCLVDEPQYLGLLLHLLGVFLLLRWLRGPAAWAEGLRGVTAAFFLASWIYPILGGVNAAVAMGLQRLRPDHRLRRALGAIGFAALLGPLLYFLQRWAVSAMFPDRLIGQRLPWQKSGESMESSGVALSNVIKHDAVWVLGMVLFVVCLSRIRRDRQLLLVLSAGQMWLFIPLFHQTLSQHPWIYGILFTPTVVLGWVGASTLLPPHRPGDSFPALVLVGVAVMIWAVQLRFFLVNYLG